MAESFFEFRQRLLAPGKPVALAADKADGALSVSDLTARIDAALRAQLPGSLLVKGEMSNVNFHRSSGHIYFTLKDSRACVDCVMFKSDAARLNFEPGDGLEVIVSGSVKLYAQRGRYQLYATALHPVGQGALELAFRQLREKLESEGLFAEDRKRILPAYPTHVALVTSRQAAALQDMLKVLRRFPWIKISVFHVPVQGDGSAEKITEALELLSRHADRLKLDVVVLARGGGSLEDLWEFNEEFVARAIVASSVPVVTGIGHEVDTSIADLVGDYHAHTPTEAAQVITHRWREAAEGVAGLAVRLKRGVSDVLRDARQRLTAVERHETFRRPTERVDRLRQRVDDLERSLASASARRLALAEKRLSRFDARLAAVHPRSAVRFAGQRLDAAAVRLTPTLVGRLQRQGARIDALARALDALSPHAVLGRGYSVTTLATGKIVRSISDVTRNTKLLTQLADGVVESRAEDPKQPELF